MWYDKMIIKLLFTIAKILARYSKKTYVFEIEKLEKCICDDEREEFKNA